MGKVKIEKKLPTPDTNPVDGDKLIEETKPKVSKKVKEDAKMIAIKELQEDVNNIGNWVADIDDELQGLSKLVIKMASRMGFK